MFKLNYSLTRKNYNPFARQGMIYKPFEGQLPTIRNTDLITSLLAAKYNLILIRKFPILWRALYLPEKREFTIIPDHVFETLYYVRRDSE